MTPGKRHALASAALSTVLGVILLVHWAVDRTIDSVIPDPPATAEPVMPREAAHRPVDVIRLPAPPPPAESPSRPEAHPHTMLQPGSGSGFEAAPPAVAPLRPQPKEDQTPSPISQLDERPEQAPTPPTPNIIDGRVHLRILEHGRGPVIEIAWPGARRAREQLHAKLAACYGMRLAELDDRGNLYVAEGLSGEPWAINMDLYSGFVRQISGRPVFAERQTVSHIRNYHPGVRLVQPVRIFPRRIDAQLLAGLARAAGGNYLSAKTIRAAYRNDGGLIRIDGIRIDGRAASGGFRLNPLRSPCDVPE